MPQPVWHGSGAAGPGHSSSSNAVCDGARAGPPLPQARGERALRCLELRGPLRHQHDHRVVMVGVPQHLKQMALRLRLEAFTVY